MYLKIKYILCPSLSSYVYLKYVNMSGFGQSVQQLVKDLREIAISQN